MEENSLLMKTEKAEDKGARLPGGLPFMDLTIIQFNRLKELVERGTSILQIAHIFNRQFQTTYEVEVVKETCQQFRQRETRGRTDWSEKMITRLRVLCAEGLSSSIIAATINCEFKTEFTRNAIIGKRSRVGIESPHYIQRKESRPRVPRKAKSTFAFPARNIVPKEATGWKPEEKPVVLWDGKSVTFNGLKNDTCRWPIDDIGKLYCGGPADLIDGRPYCPGHTDIAYDHRGTKRSNNKYQSQKAILA